MANNNLLTLGLIGIGLYGAVQLLGKPGGAALSVPDQAGLAAELKATSIAMGSSPYAPNFDGWANDWAGSLSMALHQPGNKMNARMTATATGQPSSWAGQAVMPEPGVFPPAVLRVFARYRRAVVVEPYTSQLASAGF